MSAEVIYTDAEELVAFIENGRFIAWSMTTGEGDAEANVEEWLSGGKYRYAITIRKNGVVVYNDTKHESILVP